MPGARRRAVGSGASTEAAPGPAGHGLFGAGSERFATCGQAAALAAVTRMIEGGAPQALLLVGPGSVGKTTLALDLAAGLLCSAPDPAVRPCHACRACRLVDRGVHQDLHRLAPEGPGRQIRIGETHEPEPGTVRHLIHECARRPVEGDHRVAVVEDAHRMNEDAQNALLKTLEEPPPGVTIVLCANALERLLPTIRSRAAILRLGTVASGATEALLVARGVDPPRAARLARLSGGRPGRALAYATAPEAVSAREEIARSLLDLVGANRTRRLVAGRDLLSRAGDVARLGPQSTDAGDGDPAPGGRGASTAASGDIDAGVPNGSERTAGPSPAERRLSARALLEAWTAVARDLAVVVSGARNRIRDVGLLEDLDAAAVGLEAGVVVAFLERLARAAELLEANANPELLVDVLVLAWPHTAPAA